MPIFFCAWTAEASITISKTTTQSGTPTILASILGFLSLFSLISPHWLFPVFSYLLKYDPPQKKISFILSKWPYWHVREERRHHKRTPLNPAQTVLCTSSSPCSSVMASPRAQPPQRLSTEQKLYFFPSYHTGVFPPAFKNAQVLPSKKYQPV